jgi:hypothetical protein
MFPHNLGGYIDDRNARELAANQSHMTNARNGLHAAQFALDKLLTWSSDIDPDARDRMTNAANLADEALKAIAGLVVIS